MNKLKFIELGKVVRKVRLDAGLSLEQAGKAIGSYPQEVCNYERGLSSIPAKKAKRLSLKTGCKFDLFVAAYLKDKRQEYIGKSK